MAILTEILLMCDGGKRGFDCPEDAPFNQDGAKDTASVSPSTLRKNAASEGWVKVGHMDYCPACAAQIVNK
ncbi:hypothetical protein [Janthinobacterium sp. UMAB-56]|uniref:hypothetical protein n=1 Tax=Janthinobacterium sp. UMAB-56 TaxID=1365361 RepID=UPI001C58B254|nr:hypothetical protein [Janthinobacterium sp. UMAB-56]